MFTSEYFCLLKDKINWSGHENGSITQTRLLTIIVYLLPLISWYFCYIKILFISINVDFIAQDFLPF